VSAAIIFENVSARYGGRSALSDVSVSFEAGKVTGIVGPNGAGKTALLRVGRDRLPHESGAVRVQDRALKDWARKRFREPSLISRRAAMRIGRWSRAIS